MSPYVIYVDFQLKPGMGSAFRKAVDANAIASCRDEPGCRRFDVIAPVGEADRILLYEIYDSEEAFGAHTRMPHFLHFDKETAAMVAQKLVIAGALVCEGSSS
jgi:(4S)-4-hydroxy-5-phosphonooxypentane-2,3-dione isomerase